MNGARASDDLWARTLHAKALERSSEYFGSAARLALQELLTRCGHSVSLVTLRTWPRELQGAAYLWAVATVERRGEGAAPPFPVHHV